MGRKLTYRPGSFYRADDRTGFPQRAERTVKEWSGLIVDRSVAEGRQPQDLVTGVRDDQAVTRPRPQQPNAFTGPFAEALDAPAAALDRLLYLASVTGVQTGHLARVVLDSGDLFQARIGAVGTMAILLDTPIPNGAATGNLVYDMGPSGMTTIQQLFDSRSAAQAASIANTTNAIWVAGFASPGDNGHGVYVRTLTTNPGGGFQSADGAWWRTGEPILRLPMFGTGLAAWQAGVAAMNAGYADSMVIPSGVWTIARAGLGNPLTQGLITITNNGALRFEPGAEVQFDYIALPLFAFVGCTRGGITGQPKFTFTGVTPPATVCTRAQYSAASGFAFTSFVGGGDYELFSLVLSNSSGLTFENFDVSSATPNDPAHIVPFVFNIKPTSATVRTTGNRVLRPKLRDFMFGVLYTQQDGIYVKDVDSDRRAGVTNAGIGPGHVIYASGLGTGTPNINCVVEGVRDGPNPIDWPASVAQNLATFAIKDSQFCEFNDVRILHPAGMVHTYQQVFDCDFRQWSWRTTDATAATVATLNFVEDNRRNRFTGYTIYAPSKIVSFGADNSGVFSDNLVDDIFIESSFDLGAAPVTGVFDFYGSNNDFRDIKLKPHAPVVGVSKQSAAVQRSGAGAGNTFECQFIGANVLPQMRRFTDSGTGSSALLAYRGPSSDINYLNNDQLAEAVSKATFVEAGVHHTRGWVTDSGVAGADSVSFQLPGRGSFLVQVDVEDNSRTGGQGGLYIVTFSAQAGTITNAQLLGAAYTRGASVTALAVAVSSTGLLTVSYTKGSAFFATVSLGWLRTGAIAA